MLDSRKIMVEYLRPRSLLAPPVLLTLGLERFHVRVSCAHRIYPFSLRRWPNCCSNPILEPFLQQPRFRPDNVIPLTNVEVSVLDVVFSTRVDDWQIQSFSKARLEVNVLPLKGEICD